MQLQQETNTSARPTIFIGRPKVFLSAHKMGGLPTPMYPQQVWGPTDAVRKFAYPPTLPLFSNSPLLSKSNFLEHPGHFQNPSHMPSSFGYYLTPCVPTPHGLSAYSRLAPPFSIIPPPPSNEPLLTATHLSAKNINSAQNHTLMPDTDKKVTADQCDVDNSSLSSQIQNGPTQVNPAESEQRFNRLRYFKRLAALLSKILKDENASRCDLALALEEREVLSSFVNKRYRLKESQRLARGSQLGSRDLASLQENLQKYNYGKRKEENMKLVFNWVFKFLKTQISTATQDKLSKDELDYFFYAHYFKRVAEEHGLNILCFYKPNFVKPVKNSEKTFNVSFIRNIQLSEHFMEDFMLALDEYMMIEYKTVIDKKLWTIFSKWEAKLEKDNFAPASVMGLARAIAGSQKSKLPWTINEIQLAINCVKTELNYRP